MKLTPAQSNFVSLIKERGRVPAHADLCPASMRTVRSLLRRGIIWEDAIGRMRPPVYRLTRT